MKPQYRKTSHSVYDIKYNLVWITKYRKPVMVGEIAKRIRDLIQQTCTSLDVEIIKGHVSRDHVHIMVSAPPYISVSKLVQSVKGRTSHKMLSEYRGLSRAFWGRHLWARGYFVASTGTLTDDVIEKYIEEQEQMERARDEEFEVEQ